jgi:hypothetical protein
MGSKIGPDFANLFMADLESRFLTMFYQTHNLKPFLYCRYIDDIFIIWTEGRESLEDFITLFNGFHPSINFTHSVSDTSVNFLDVTVKLEHQNTISTTLFRKPTDNPSYLHYFSDHPSHIKRPLPYSLALRCKRICSNVDDAEAHITALERKFTERKYPVSLVKNACRKALNSPTNSIEKKAK